jgi:hypothetical protein
MKMERFGTLGVVMGVFNQGANDDKAVQPEQLSAGVLASDDVLTANGKQVERELDESIGDLDLPQALLACFTSRESRRWTVAELDDRLRGFGIRKSPGVIARLLGELSVELQLLSWSPWTLVEGPTDWILEPKTLLVSLLSGHRKITGQLAKLMTERHKAVLLVVLGYRVRGGISRTRLAEVLGLSDVSAELDGLRGWGVAYAGVVSGVVRWFPTKAALLALGYRSSEDIPALAELEKWFEAQEREVAEKRERAQATGNVEVTTAGDGKLEKILDNNARWRGRRLSREADRRGSVATLDPLPSPTPAPDQQF